VLVVSIDPDGARSFWTPLVLGLSYLAAAAAGGRHGGRWATACALTGWGAAVALAGAARPALDIAELDPLGDARTYAGALATVALANLALAASGLLARDDDPIASDMRRTAR